MLTIQIKWYLVAISLALLLPFRLVADEKDNFLDAVKKSDERVKNIINKHKISYLMTTSANPLSPNQGLVLKKCEASWMDDTLSMHIVYSYMNPPVYSPSEQRIDYAKDGALIIWRPIEKYIQFSPTRNEVFQKSKAFYAYPNGLIKEANDSTYHLIYPIGKTDNIVEYSHFESATGRGIS